MADRQSPFPLDRAPEDVRKLMAEIGPVWGKNIPKHREMTLAAYGPLLARAPKDRVKVTRDAAYGAHPRQVVDVFQPDAARNVPVMIFVHGGAFVRGDKRVSDEVYDNVLYYLARQGVLGLNIEYRLAPESRHPGGARDVADAVAWAEREAPGYGGDPTRIYIMGHSAGGTHVATWAFDRTVIPERPKSVAGVILASARVRADVLPDNPNADAVRAYFGDDTSLYEARSPVTHANDPNLPMFIAIAEFENPYLDVYGAELLHRLSLVRKRAPRFLRLTRHNHISLVAHFNTEEDIFGREILDFIEQGR
ncbi:MAG: alpha/beta hydrolase [Burkholderiales bacterium]